uniref:Zinc finger protein-like 1 homolog n=1 Tax=Moina brachiata TaxID=675436 RepID=A0A4Y7NIY2_9CRUS|nr:EOG090X0ASS [Moina brachiata]SVE93180.1 EOG090X0ASS [Moina brachiata]
MGLCKCPKRKVTNQFCFEHRVNVCESCMVSNHPKCVIQSYTQWLKDSDYSSLCPLCSSELSEGECVRLICYHVFHTKCLDAYCRQYPPNTAPAGYVCASCSSSVFPQSNLVSPVADVLREVLSNYPWAREGLELPLLPFDGTEQQNQLPTSHIQAPPPKKETPNFSVVNVENESSNTFHRSDSVSHSHVKRSTEILHSDRDEGVNKYKRRPPWEAFKRILSNMLDPHAKKRHRGQQRRRYVLVLVLVVFALFFMFALGSRIFNTPAELEAPLNAPFQH